MRQEVPTWLFIAVVVLVAAVAVGLIWWRTSVQRPVKPLPSPEEMKREWMGKLQKGYIKPHGVSP